MDPNDGFIISSVLLTIVITISYLLPLSRATIYRDDWYYTVDRIRGGPQTFHSMFAIDRPARGYFLSCTTICSVLTPTPYLSYALRLASGLAALWLLFMLWPGRWEAALMMSLFFVLYPGYTHWLEGFENQPSTFSLFLALISILFTLKALSASRPLEWMPFLQAYAMLDDEAGFAQVASRIASAESGGNISVEEAAVISEYNRRQACSVLESMQDDNLAFSARMQARIAEALCW
jgi:hypothetical protein